MEDNLIIDMYLARNEDAINCTATKYGKRLNRISSSIIEDLDVADECENDTYLAAWNSIPPNEPREYFYPYLARIIRNISLNICRDRSALKRKAYIAELTNEMEQCIPGNMGVEYVVDEMVLKELLNNFLKNLDKRKRRLFVRRYWYLDSVACISKRYMMSESNVKTTLFRIRNDLRCYLEKEGYSL